MPNDMGIGSVIGGVSRRIIAYAVLALVALACVWLAISSYMDGKNAKVETKLAKNQTEAGIASGKDAVNTTAAVAERDRQTDQTTLENDRAIRNAEGADAPVTDDLRDTGLRSLCQRRSYSDDPRCVQFAPAK